MTQSITVLLTNDDGIDAPGLAAVEHAFAKVHPIDLWLVAPASPRSTSSHAMHLARPVFAEEKGSRRVAVDGYPADCVYLALFGLMERPPDVVVSGINHGANLGNDVIYSGTVACAREAALHGVHGIAASLVDGDDFARAAESVCRIALAVAKLPKDRTVLLNLNYPAGRFQGPRLARLGVRRYPRIVSRRTAPLDSSSYYWLGGPPVQDSPTPGTDSWLIGQGIASATPLALDQTDSGKLDEAETRFRFMQAIEDPI